MRSAISLVAGLLFACGGPGSTPSETGGATNEQVSMGGSSQQPLGQGGSSGNSSANAQCQLLQDRADGPRLSLTGTACGQPLSFTTSGGQMIELSRRSLSLPFDEISTITVKDDPSNYDPTLPDYFDDFSLLFNVALQEEGPTLEAQSGEYAVEMGLLVACGFGSLGFDSGMAQVAIETVEGDYEGQIRMSVSGIAVLGFDPEFGKTELPSCDGTVSVTLEGPYSHNPG